MRTPRAIRKRKVDKIGGITSNTNMKLWRIVIDPNVLVAALRSRRGASYRLLMSIERAVYDLVVSVPLVLEYEAAANKQARQTALTPQDIEGVIDFICAQAMQAKVYYLWRPLLKDPKDDMVLEAAVAAGCTHIITFNVKDFVGAERFGIKAMTPREFLAVIGELP